MFEISDAPAVFALDNRRLRLQPKLQPRFLRLSVMISQYRFTAAFPRRAFGNVDRRAADPTSDRYAGRRGLILLALPADAEGQQ